MSRPAPVRVGLLGRKSRSIMAWRNSSAYFLPVGLVLSAEAM